MTSITTNRRDFISATGAAALTLKYGAVVLVFQVITGAACLVGLIRMARRVGSIRAHGLNVAAALESKLGVAVLVHAALVAARRQQLGIRGVGGCFGSVRLFKEGLAKFVVLGKASGGSQQQGCY